MAMVGWRSLLGFQVERWIAIWVFLAGTSRGLEIERWSRMGPCAPGKSFGDVPLGTSAFRGQGDWKGWPERL